MGNKIRKIKLSNGQVYSFFDANALRLDEDNRLIVDDPQFPTGNPIIDKVILEGHLYITEVDDIEVNNETTYKVLVQESGDNFTGEILGRDKDKILADIGGAAYQMNDDTLSLNIGKFE